MSDHTTAVKPQIDFVGLRYQYEELKPEIDRAVQSVISRAAFVGGAELDQFETWFAAYCGVPHAIGVGSGTSAISLVLRAASIGVGDEVIVPAQTFIATASAVIGAGARPLLVDVSPDTGCIDPAAVEASVTQRTKAIIAVHLYGRPARMRELAAIAEKRGLLLIEDAAQAHGAVYHGRRAGSIGAAGCFSFYPTKNLGAFGDGGLVTTSDSSIDRGVRLLRDHGRVSKYEHQVAGFTDRLDNLQAAVLQVQASRLDEWNLRRRQAAVWYRECLPRELAPPADEHGVESVYHVFAIRVVRRDDFRARLEAHGIPTAIHYPLPLHRQPALAHLGHAGGSFPNAERLAAETVSLPMHPFLRRSDVEYIAGAVRAVVES